MSISIRCRSSCATHCWSSSCSPSKFITRFSIPLFFMNFVLFIIWWVFLFIALWFFWAILVHWMLIVTWHQIWDVMDIDLKRGLSLNENHFWGFWTPWFHALVLDCFWAISYSIMIACSSFVVINLEWRSHQCLVIVVASYSIKQVFLTKAYKCIPNLGNWQIN